MMPGEALRALTDAVAAQDWDGLAGLLAADFSCRYLHTGETLDGEAYVRLNREYPGSWSLVLQDALADGDRAAGWARVSDGVETYHVAMFLRVRDGAVQELVEVWADPAVPPTDRRPPDSSG